MLLSQIVVDLVAIHGLVSQFLLLTVVFIYVLTESSGDESQAQGQQGEQEQRLPGQHESYLGHHSAASDTGNGSKDTSYRGTEFENGRRQWFREDDRRPTDITTDGDADEWADRSVENTHYYFKLSSTSEKPNSFVDRSLPFFLPPALPV